MHGAPLSTVESDARTRLLEAALEVFGTCNLEGATTRQLAERAGVNQAAIPYYFGGKEGLYLAVVQHLFERKASQLIPTFDAIDQALAGVKLQPDQALLLLKKMLGRFLEVLLSDGASASWGRIIMREQMQPTKAFDIVYNAAIRRTHERVSKLLAILLGRQPEDRSVIFRAHMLLGHVLIYLSGRETIRRRLNLHCFAPEEIDEIRSALFEQLDLLLPPRR